MSDTPLPFVVPSPIAFDESLYIKRAELCQMIKELAAAAQATPRAQRGPRIPTLFRALAAKLEAPVPVVPEA